MNTFFPLVKIIMDTKASRRLFWGSVLSFSFSIAVILSTIGLMNGFEKTLHLSLKKTTGDLILSNRDSFFNLDVAKELIGSNFLISPLVEMEGFFVENEQSKGILVRGIEPTSFEKITKLKLNLTDNEIAIGSELSKSFNLGIGDEGVLILSSAKKEGFNTPELLTVRVKEIINHGIYEKDLRFLYINQNFLKEALSLEKTLSNKVLINLPKSENLEEIAKELSSNFPKSYKVTPYYKEYGTLLEAVEVEKKSIAMILQIIVVVAIFNVIAFIFFINEKKSQEFFLLRALGTSMKSLKRFWFGMVILIWSISMAMSLLLTQVFNFLLEHLPLFKIPGDVYVLSSLKLYIELEPIIIVGVISFIWIFVLSFIGISKIQKQSILSGLRKEFR